MLRFLRFAVSILLVSSSTIVFESAILASASPLTWSDKEIASTLNFPEFIQFYGSATRVNSVSCTSSNFCVAGGSYKDKNENQQGFLSVYNGSRWSDIKVAVALNLSNYAQVNSVSCTSSNFCVAGGSYTDNDGHQQAFVTVYNGSKWSDIEVAATIGLGTGGKVNSVSCTSSNFCVAVGHSDAEYGNYQGFVSVYDGSTWLDSPLEPSAFNSDVSLVSCTSSSFCVAGGSISGAEVTINNNGSVSSSGTFVSIYNGATWSDSLVGPNNLGSVYFNALSCTSSSFCVVGGEYGNSGFSFTPFVSVYNGTKWINTVIASGLNVANDAGLSSVSCTSSSFCVAGGFYADGRSYNSQLHAYVSVFNGNKWIDKQIVGPGPAQVESISCASARGCVAGGSYGFFSENTDFGLAFGSVFSGTAWTDLKVAANLNIDTAEVTSVSCSSSGFCAAGGTFSDAKNGSHAFVSTIALQNQIVTIAKTVSISITCYKGKLTKKITAVKPVCPNGYSIKK